MKKLYYATQLIDVMFVGEDTSKAEYFLREEFKNVVTRPTIIKEIDSISEIPKHWLGCPLWGIYDEKDMNPEEFLNQKDPEYEEYLRLKKKFEK